MGSFKWPTVYCKCKKTWWITWGFDLCLSARQRQYHWATALPGDTALYSLIERKTTVIQTPISTGSTLMYSLHTLLKRTIWKYACRERFKPSIRMEVDGEVRILSQSMRVRAVKLLWVRFLQFHREGGLCEHFEVLHVWRVKTTGVRAMTNVFDFVLFLKNTASHYFDYITYYQTRYTTSIL